MQKEGDIPYSQDGRDKTKVTTRGGDGRKRSKNCLSQTKYWVSILQDAGSEVGAQIPSGQSTCSLERAPGPSIQALYTWALGRALSASASRAVITETQAGGWREGRVGGSPDPGKLYPLPSPVCPGGENTPKHCLSDKRPPLCSSLLLEKARRPFFSSFSSKSWPVEQGVPTNFCLALAPPQ